MYKRIAFSLIIAVIFVVTSQAMAEPREKLLLVAHRGVVTDTLTENSLASLEETIRRGYSHIEVDVRCTKDGQPICSHDDNLRRVTGVNARVRELTLQEVRKLVDAETVPLLEEFCARAAGRIELMPDIKDVAPELTSRFGEALVEVLERHDLLSRALFIGNHKYLPQERQEGRVSTGATPDELRERMQADPNYAATHFVFAHAKDFTADNVKAYHALGLPVIVSINLFHYPVAQALEQGLSDIQSMLDFGVDGLQIDADYDEGLAHRE